MSDRGSGTFESSFLIASLSSMTNQKLAFGSLSLLVPGLAFDEGAYPCASSLGG